MKLKELMTPLQSAKDQRRMLNRDSFNNDGDEICANCGAPMLTDVNPSDDVSCATCGYDGQDEADNVGGDFPAVNA